MGVSIILNAKDIEEYINKQKYLICNLSEILLLYYYYSKPLLLKKNHFTNLSQIIKPQIKKDHIMHSKNLKKLT